MSRWEAARRRIARCWAEPLPERELRAAVLAEIRAVVPAEAYAWVLTDPRTSVGAAPLAEVPVPADLPAVIRAKYLTRFNRWTGLTGVAALSAGDPAAGSPWREVLARYGVRDVASAVFRDRFGCWGFLDLWRTGGTFTTDELGFLGSLLPGVTAAQRAAVAATFEPVAAAAPGGPVVLLLSDALVPLSRTPGTDAHLRALLPTPPDRSPVPAAALNAGAQLLAVEAGIDAGPPYARLHLVGGLWVGLRAARLDPGGVLAVTIEPVTPAERLDVYARAAGLTPRERDVLGRLALGDDTRGTARRLGIAENTVHDHLKSIFTKTGARA